MKPVSGENVKRFKAIQASTLQPHFERVKSTFTAFLNRYSQNAFLLETAQPAISVLKSELDYLKSQLGENFLGLALGGSLVRGLGTIRTSDVDYRIYVRNINASLAGKIKARFEAKLAEAGMEACDKNPFIQLNENNPDTDPLAPLTVFTNYFISSVDQESLRQSALNSFETIIKFGKIKKKELLEFLRKEHRQLTACEPEKVADKFLKNRTCEVVPEEEKANDIAYSKKYAQELMRIARPYLEARQKILPFPRQIEDMLS